MKGTALQLVPHRLGDILQGAAAVVPLHELGLDGLAHARRGGILQDLQQYPQAVESYRQALIQRPQDTRLMLLFGACLGHLREYEAAATAYRYAVTLDGNNAGLLARLGFVLHQLGRFAEAEESLARALQIEPDNSGWSKLLEEWRQSGQG